MKTIAFTLALYICCLTGFSAWAKISTSPNKKLFCKMSCCMRKTMNNKTANPKQQAHDCCSKGVCSIAQSCYCCTTILNQPQQILTRIFLSTPSFTSETQHYKLGNYLSTCWHPPQLS